MSYVLLRRQALPNPDSTGLPVIEVSDFWDTIRRTYYTTQTPVQAGTDFELADGDEVDRWQLPAGGGKPSKVRIVVYRGQGRVSTRNEAGGIGGPVCTLQPPILIPNPAVTSQAGVSDSAVDVRPVSGVGPYSITLTGAKGYSETKSAQTALYPIRFYGLIDDSYAVDVTDAIGCKSIATLAVQGGISGIPYGTLLQDQYSGGNGGGSGTRVIWNTNTLQVENYIYQDQGEDSYNYQYEQGGYADGYLLPDGITLRTVYSDGNGSVYFVDSDTTNKNSKLSLDNLILFNPDSVAEQNGGALLEMNATALPLTFSLNGVSNTTGSFDGLAAADYAVTVTDAAGNSVVVRFMLELRYAPWRVLVYDDLDSTPLELELWLRDYEGEPTTIIAQGERPVVLKSDGLNSTMGGQGDVPSVVGTACELNLVVLPGELETVVISDDRACRVDIRRMGQLEFRGYIKPDIYNEPLLSGYLQIGITATDGLADLKQTDMLGHIGQRLQGRRPLLNTLLHCLSRCGIALPLRIFTNRREATMSEQDAPELAAVTERNAYWDESKSEPKDQRTVLDAICQALGGTLVQREGTWQLRSALEAAADAAGRAYRPAGTAEGAVLAAAPTGRVAPLSDSATQWGWEGGGQQKQVRPAWKSLTGTTDAGWLKNAFPAGEVFSDKYSWLEDKSKLRPINGWVPAPGLLFPLVLVRGGEKGTDFSTQWLRSAGDTETRYLESPVLPLSPVPENCPAYLTIRGKLLPEAYFAYTAIPIAGTAPKASFLYDIVVDGQSQGKPSEITFTLAKAGDKEVEVTVPLPTLAAGVTAAVLRLYPWTSGRLLTLSNARVYDRNVANHSQEVIKYDFGTGVYRLFQYYNESLAGFSPAPTGLPGDNYQEIPATDEATGRLLISEVAIQLRPQEATWDGEDNFRADGPAGTVRPTEALEVFHPDVPIQAGLFEGNRHAFSKAISLADNSLSTDWARDLDKQGSPIFEAAVYDSLALRAGPAILLTGTLRHRGVAPYLLDSVDTPFDVPGRRFFFAATEWDLKACTVQLSAIEVGPGSDAPDPLLELPEGVRVTNQSYWYTPLKFTSYVRLTNGGVRVRHV
jgi:hypothetical protein